MTKTLGIVLTYVKYGENSIVVNVYTQVLGRQSYMVNGIRSGRKKGLIALMQPLTIVEMEVSNRPNKELQRISDLKIHWPFATIPFNPTRRAIAFFITEVIAKSIKEEEPNEPLFDFLIQSVQALDEGIPAEHNFHIFFMIQLSRLLGFAPNNNDNSLPIFDLLNGQYTRSAPIHRHYISGDEKSLWVKLNEIKIDTLNELRINADDRQRLINLLEEYYTLHLPAFTGLKTHHILHQLTTH